LDKGTFDALSPPPNDVKKSRNKSEIRDSDDESDEQKSEKVELMMKEISRVIKSNGRFICVSLLQPHVASRLLSFFYNLGWMVRIQRCLDAERKTSERTSNKKSVVFPVFMCVFTKFKLPEGMKPVSLKI
jgi:hypothetical protein